MQNSLTKVTFIGHKDKDFPLEILDPFLPAYDLHLQSPHCVGVFVSFAPILITYSNALFKTLVSFP